MDRWGKKRGREADADADHRPPPPSETSSSKKGKLVVPPHTTHPDHSFSGDVAADGGLGVFEFPWQKGKGGGVAPPDDDGWDLRHVFFSSLVDGSSAAIGFPGDRLSRASAKAMALDDEAGGSWPLTTAAEKEIDGIWSSVLGQPLATKAAAGPRVKSN